MGRAYFKNKQKKVQTKQEQEDFSVALKKSLDENLTNLKKILDNPNDLIIRKISVRNSQHECAIVCIDGLVNADEIYSNILKNVQLVSERKEIPVETDALLDMFLQSIVSAMDIKKGYTMDDVSNALLYGSTILYLDGIDKVLIMDTRGWDYRNIEEPISETLIRGSREGFVENLRTNTVLLRRYIRDPNLHFKTYQIGRRSKSDLVLAYISGIIHPDLVKEIKRRLETIDMDGALESGYIEQWVEDSFLSPFPQFLNTERPDKVASALMDGKFAIFLDGTPFVIVAPSVFSNSMQSQEDYYERWTIGTLLRGIRYLGGFIAVFLPALYIALVAYQPGMLPSRLAFSIAATREGVPFPAFVEATLMVVTMELLREAGARLPTTIGQTIGIVGGLVIGDAAVQAGIVSPVMVVVVALNAIASFSIPQYSIAISFRIILFGYMVAAALFGIYGVILTYIMTNIHIVNLRSMGVPFSSPFAPTFWGDWRNLVLRMPIPMLNRRPGYLKPNDRISGERGGRQS